jgi:hypothetical protein
MTGSLNEMLAKEHVRDLLAKAEGERLAASVRAGHPRARAAIARLLRGRGPARARVAVEDPAEARHPPVEQPQGNW